LKAYAKINLALVVGPTRDDGKHEVVTVLQRIDLYDEVDVARSDRKGIDVSMSSSEGAHPPVVENIVTRALGDLSRAAGVEPRWKATIEKRIPIAAGLGGGSSDAASALRIANETLDEPLVDAELHALAASLGSDVPFFLTLGTQLGTGDGSTLARIEVPRDYIVLLLFPNGAVKESTAAVYARFDREARFEQRRKYLLEALKGGDLASLPPNDLASSPLAARVAELGAFRADVSGAGPAVYGLFADAQHAERAATSLRGFGRTLVVAPAW
jgi:4-diphosphocytidyl-2-C-methyl-D-erythritol kinase